MPILITGHDLPEISGTLLNHSDTLAPEWNNCKNLTGITLVIGNNPAAAALALKVWPELDKKINEIICPISAAKIDPEGLESLLNCGVTVVLCPTKAAAAAYAENSGDFKSTLCGAHVETMPGPAYGKLVTDLESDHKFLKKNARFVF